MARGVLAPGPFARKLSDTMGADPAEPSEAPYILRERHYVALFETGDDGHNTIVVGGVDVVVPIEIDIDGDPLHDDEVCLRSIHGLYEHVLSVGSADVTPDPDRRLAFYRFRYVPPGLYRVAVRIGGKWVPMGTALSVRKDGVYWNDTKLTSSPPDVKAAEGDPALGLVDAEAEDPGCGTCGGGHWEHEHD